MEDRVYSVCYYIRKKQWKMSHRKTTSLSLYKVEPKNLIGWNSCYVSRVKAVDPVVAFQIGAKLIIYEMKKAGIA